MLITVQYHLDAVVPWSSQIFAARKKQTKEERGRKVTFIEHLLCARLFHIHYIIRSLHFSASLLLLPLFESWGNWALQVERFAKVKQILAFEPPSIWSHLLYCWNVCLKNRLNLLRQENELKILMPSLH